MWSLVWSCDSVLQLALLARDMHRTFGFDLHVKFLQERLAQFEANLDKSKMQAQNLVENSFDAADDEEHAVQQLEDAMASVGIGSGYQGPRKALNSMPSSSDAKMTADELDALD